MKTTIELPDRLLRAAKAAAARRNTTLKTLFQHALEREISSADNVSSPLFAVDDDGLPYLPSRGVIVTNEMIRELDQEDSSSCFQLSSAAPLNN